MWFIFNNLCLYQSTIFIHTYFFNKKEEKNNHPFIQLPKTTKISIIKKTTRTPSSEQHHQFINITIYINTLYSFSEQVIMLTLYLSIYISQLLILPVSMLFHYNFIITYHYFHSLSNQLSLVLSIQLSVFNCVSLQLLWKISFSNFQFVFCFYLCIMFVLCF